ncbi:MAG: AAA family ATPase [Chloroflexota bacterium]
MPASGKGTFHELLRDELDRRHISCVYYSLSDELRAEVRRCGLAVDREVLRAVGHELRQKYGSDVLSGRVLERMALDGERGDLPAAAIVDAIRNPAEVRRLRASLGDDFVLVAVEAPVDAVVLRIRARGRQGDVGHTEDLARQMLAAEMGLDEPEYGHNIAECISMADVKIDNSGDLGDLGDAVARFVDERLVPFL